MGGAMVVGNYQSKTLVSFLRGNGVELCALMDREGFMALAIKLRPVSAITGSVEHPTSWIRSHL